MVKNVLANGMEAGDLTGHVVKAEEVPAAYEVLDEATGKKEDKQS